MGDTGFVSIPQSLLAVDLGVQWMEGFLACSLDLIGSEGYMYT